MSKQQHRAVGEDDLKRIREGKASGKRGSIVAVTKKTMCPRGAGKDGKWV